MKEEIKVDVSFCWG